MIIKKFQGKTENEAVESAKKELGNNVMFVMNLPWRGVARMSGVLSDEHVLALIDMINRKKGGFRNFLKQAFRK